MGILLSLCSLCLIMILVSIMLKLPTGVLFLSEKHAVHRHWEWVYPLKHCVLFAGIHSITTVGRVSVKAGASISIPCLYSSQYRNHVKFLCVGYYWSSCSYAIKTNQLQSSGKYSISDDKNQKIFIVTIKHLADGNTDYWCAVEINRGPDVRQYFQLFVTSGKNSFSCTFSNISWNCNTVKVSLLQQRLVAFNLYIINHN